MKSLFLLSIMALYTTLSFAAETIIYDPNRKTRRGDPHYNTEMEMMQIYKALERYFKKVGYFPESLNQLQPRYLRTLSNKNLNTDDWGEPYHYQRQMGCPQRCVPLKNWHNELYYPQIPQFAQFISKGHDRILGTPDDIDFTTPSSLLMWQKLNQTQLHLQTTRLLLQEHINQQRDDLLQQIITKATAEPLWPKLSYITKDAWKRYLAFDPNQGLFYSLGLKGETGLDQPYYIYDDTPISLPPPQGFKVSLVKRCPSGYKDFRIYESLGGNLDAFFANKTHDCVENHFMFDSLFKPYIKI